MDNEIRIARSGGEGHIVAKMNSLLDKPVIQKLYEASMAGVQIELIVRGICTLRPGLEGISEHISVRSIVGRQLAIIVGVLHGRTLRAGQQAARKSSGAPPGKA